MNTLTWIIIGFYSAAYLLETVLDVLNLRVVKEKLPPEFDGVYSEEDYEKSQKYLRETTSFGLVKSAIFFIATLAFILLGGFEYADLWARAFGFGPIITGLLFFFGLNCLVTLPGIVFSLYGTFIIEKKYGFNKMTAMLFVTDFIKAQVLTVLIGGPVLGAVLWFFYKTGDFAWLWTWAFVSIFQLVMLVIGPTLIMPLFNKFTRLEDGELRTKIENYATSQRYKLNGLFKMDGSKRSTKSNAFFTGLGKAKRIVLFDTLIEKHEVDGLVGVIAHEMGHFKKGHVLIMITFSIVSSAFMLFLLSLSIGNPNLFAAFSMSLTSVYASFVLFSFLYIPIQMILGLLSSLLSRKHEFEADEFAVRTTGKKGPLIKSLKTLTVDNLSNLTPHPWKVFFEYSHPPVLKRIEAINKIELKDV
ncbi:M48 family metallopeptidase [bacterium]|jgi:STE24 endopeptidase|nr:M48 family metallopeptidase [bacterium]